MPELPWSKFFWSDWMSDPALKQCSLAAQGLWMRMLCICAMGDPIGYLTIGGNPLCPQGVATAVGAPLGEVESLMAELANWGVYSRDRKGRIYSRRIVRDAERSAKARKNGKMGGNPSLSKQKENNGSVKGMDKGEDKTQRPEARGQSIEEVSANAATSGAQQARGETEDGGWTPDKLHAEVLAAVGIRDTWPTHWMPPAATIHVWRWHTELGMTCDQIISAARSSRGQHADPPRGPKALDGTMTRVVTASTTPIAGPSSLPSDSAAKRSRWRKIAAQG